MKEKSAFTLRAVEVIRRIPTGKVATYGQIAALAGSRQGARQIAWILNSCWETERLPWHRVVNSSGTISLKGEGKELQQRMLEAEGVIFDKEGRINLGVFLWKP